MIIEVKIPALGESVSFAEIAGWLVEDGDVVEKDQEIAEIDSDKATLALPAEESGKIKIMVEAGSKVAVGDIVCTIDTSVKPEAKPEMPQAEEKPQEKAAPKIEKQEPKTPKQEKTINKAGDHKVSVSPVASQMIQAEGLNVDEILQHKLMRISKSDVEAYMAGPVKQISREEHREEMSSLRKKLAERLVKVKNETAMLTTFNEVDLSRIIELRKKHQKAFVEKYGVKVGFMSFFTKAVAYALEAFPSVNARLDGNEIVYNDYKDIGIAVSTPKGLMVPVLRNAEALSIADIEIQIAELAQKARNRRLSLDEMTGGTFTITNGGVFGSMLSTPIINPPQVAILGMHNIQERPVAINGKVEIRPMMYLALSYDHRIIDGKESVSFLVKIKELLQDPGKLLSGNDPVAELLGI